MQVPQKEHLYKLLVIGDLGVGKTSIIKRYVHQNFSSHYRATIGVDFALKVLHWDPETVVRLQLWDIAGEPRGRELGRGHLADHPPGQGSGSRPRGDPGLPPRRCAARDFSGWTANLRFRRNKKSFFLARGNFTCVPWRFAAAAFSPSHSLPWDLWAQRGPPRDPEGDPPELHSVLGPQLTFRAPAVLRVMPPEASRPSQPGAGTPEGKPLDRLTAGTWRVPD